MSLTDFATGAQGALQQMLARRLEAQRYADKIQQQGFENSMATRRQGALEEQNALINKRLLQADEDMRQTRLATRADALSDQLPPDTFLPETDPAVATMQQGGRGALLMATPATEPMGADFTGPMPGGETPQQAQVGRSKGFLKTASAAQIKAQQDAADKRADNERQAQRDSESQRHNRALESAAARQAAATGQNRDIQNQLNELKLQTERDKLDRATADRATAKDNAKSTTETALKLVRDLRGHKGFSTAYGNVSSRFSGFDQNAVDAGAVRDQLVAALTMPNLGALKGPASDKDVLFLKQLSTRLGNPRISEQEAQKALAEAETWLQDKLGIAPGGSVVLVAPDGTERAVPADQVEFFTSRGARVK